MALEDDIHIRISGCTGRITLTRPEALNAMTYDMCMAIGAALSEWQDNPEIQLVVIDAEGERSFCSGGDIADLYATGKAGDYAYGRKFWADEYRINAQIKNYTKPYVAIMDGIVMGGGVGISAHGSHRIVTENTLFAMPECGIGLVPDVGGNQLLAGASGHIGEYLGTTGARLKAADCLFAGIGDLFVPAENLRALINALEETGDLSVLDSFAKEPETGSLTNELEAINSYFAKGSAAEIISRLEATDGEWETNAAKLMRRNCPLSVACAVEIVRQSRDLKTIEDILALEYRFTYRSMSHGDFIEGIRAQIIDKDRKPNWNPSTLEGLEENQISGMLEPLGNDELTF
ncbi:MAG: enoyl-CoA hydratase/isomerase family protein [Rhizobiaceae bacterium]|nr:enoyl-CoA hydratase/isomerase family protein [Rhizobiaceae bacterium]